MIQFNPYHRYRYLLEYLPFALTWLLSFHNTHLHQAYTLWHQVASNAAYVRTLDGLSWSQGIELWVVMSRFHAKRLRCRPKISWKPWNWPGHPPRPFLESFRLAFFKFSHSRPFLKGRGNIADVDVTSIQPLGTFRWYTVPKMKLEIIVLQVIEAICPVVIAG